MRGYESFYHECFAELRDAPEIELHLFKGGGAESERSTTLWNISRWSRTAAVLARLRFRDKLFYEHASFFLHLLPYLIKEKPELIVFSDEHLGHLLWHWRRLTGQNYKLLMRNGGCLPLPHARWDYVHQLSPVHLASALAAGEPAHRQGFIPQALRLPSQPPLLSIDERQSLRRKLGLPSVRAIVLSVAAINCSHKRLHYLIEELARLPAPRPFLILLGQIEDESPRVIELAERLLGVDSYAVRTVESSEVGDYYDAADLFVLTSLVEGSPRVLPEAMAHGLPCLVHENDINRSVLEEYGYYADFTLPQSLTSLLLQVMRMEALADDLRRARHRAVYERFSWTKLRPAYLAMFQGCINATEKLKE